MNGGFAGVSRRMGLFLTLLLLACNDITDLGELEIVETEADAEGIAVNVTQGSVTVVGTIITPDPCYELFGRIRREGSAITLHVTALGQGAACPAVIARQGYRVSIGSLSPGMYDLIVIHTYSNTGWEDRRFEEEVSVPD